MRLIAFHQTAFDDYSDWARADKKLFDRIRRMIIETAKTPFDGIGKPEPLSNSLEVTGRVVSQTNIGSYTKSRMNI